jgi:hypothetical protein
MRTKRGCFGTVGIPGPNEIERRRESLLEIAQFSNIPQSSEQCT